MTRRMSMFGKSRSFRPLIGFIAFLVLGPGSALAQTGGCDEGVIRLPDRSGTIQICSAVSARVPELARQLKQATEALGSQQAQIAELTRLVRGLNNVSREIGTQRQIEMMQNLSAELERGRRDQGKEALAQINERLDGLQSSLLSAMSNPKMSAALGDALKGPVGEAIAKLDLTGANKQIDDIMERLKAIQSGVTSIQNDTSAIRQQLAQMDERQQAVQNATERREAATLDVLRKLSNEIRDLGQRGGLIDNPRGYSAHYHNARVLTQRGEIDLAIASYRQVFRTGVQMADPVIDLTTLLIRQYGRQGALRALAKDFKADLPELSYLYAMQTLSDGELDEVESLLFANPQRAADFPPLASVYLRRLHERISRKRVDLNPYTFQWSDTAGMGAVALRLDREIESGNYLAFFIDQVRAGRDLDEFRAISDAFKREKILQVRVPNLGMETYRSKAADLMSSPIGLDYTYFFEPPAHETLAHLAREALAFPRYNKGSVFVYIWDVAIDVQKPIQVCAPSSNSAQCRDINAPSQRCTNSVGSRPVNCTMQRSLPNGYFPPRLEAHFIPQDLLGHQCIGRVSYTTTSGREVVINGKDLIAAYRRKMDPDVEKLIKSCGYDNQILEASSPTSLQQAAGTASSVSFASSIRADWVQPNNRESCDALGQHHWVYSTRTLASYKMDEYLISVARHMNTLPELPDLIAGEKRFDQATGRCTIQLLIKEVPHVCTIDRLVKSHWLPKTDDNSDQRNERMASVGQIWNSGIYPDAKSPIRCEAIKSDERASQKRKPSGRQIKDIKTLESDGLDDELVALGAGHGPGCDTKGYTDIRYRVAVDLGFRAIERNVCGSAEKLRKTLLDSSRTARAQRLNGCFTASAMSTYQSKAEAWLKTAASDCNSSEGKQAKEWAKEASEWALERK